MTSTQANSKGLRRIADVLGGEKVIAGIDRRIKAEVARQVARTVGENSDQAFTIGVLLGARGRADRTLNQKRYARLAREICTLTSQKNVDWQLQQAYRSLSDLEARGLGRIAGGTYNILGKLVTPPLLAAPAGPILEIGTLYGLFSPALVRSFRREGEFRSLTVIDPFAGLQVQGGENLRPDRSGTPVTEDVARWNFEELGVPGQDLRVVSGFSTDPTAKAKVADQKYAVIVIDGDHSDPGVEKDLWWVQDIALPGAIVVMDDFGDPKWPGVESAARRYLAEGGKLELLGTASTSAYLRMPTN